MLLSSVWCVWQRCARAAAAVPASGADLALLALAAGLPDGDGAKGGEWAEGSVASQRHAKPHATQREQTTCMYRGSLRGR